MKYVLDASIALKWVLSEPDAAKARQLRDDFRNAVHELIAPDSFTVEIAHALTKAQRRGMIPDAWALWADVMTTVPHLFPAHPMTPRAIQIATQARIGVYDCLYVALAEREGCELVTADARLLNSLQPTYPFLIALASVP
ncbi:MAG TPA: type II toxin-antitoxin system VapC family toxin [Isosphaeraceae bacterium]|nr:type II toxin-antitoxin system VapC family toxin [Isosphaeraceae bacterium]